MAIHAAVPKFGVEPNYNFFLSRFSNVAKLLSAADAIKALGSTSVGRFQVSPADGDKLQMFFICNGTETKLEISGRKMNNTGIFDLYVNGVLDTAGLDDYAAVSADIHREITLANAIRIGMNTVELRINGKNVGSSNYYLSIQGASLQ